MIPFVWRDYDILGKYNITEWQRVQEFDELYEKILELRDKDNFEYRLYEYRARYSQVLLSEDEYYHEFKKKMNFSLDI